MYNPFRPSSLFGVVMYIPPLSRNLKGIKLRQETLT
jgi:hypothetical protein